MVNLTVAVESGCLLKLSVNSLRPPRTGIFVHIWYTLLVINRGDYCGKY